MADFIQRSRHGTVYHFRRRIPRDLTAQLGREQLVYSLHTQSQPEAIRRRALAGATDRLFARLRAMAQYND